MKEHGYLTHPKLMILAREPPLTGNKVINSK